MLLSGILLDLKPEYVAKLENGVFIVGFSDGTALGSDGRNYRHVAEYDEEENMISDGWQLA